jgi:hypothetical protein
MNWQQFIGNALGLDNVQSIDHIGTSFAAPWARGTGATWVLFGCIALGTLAFWYYTRWQGGNRPVVRSCLAVARALVLALLLLLLAEPVLRIELTNVPRPLLWVLFDGTDSMAIRDEQTEEERQKLAAAVNLDPAQVKAQLEKNTNQTPTASAADAIKPSRMDYVQALLRQPPEKNLLHQLQEQYRVKAFILDQADGVRPLNVGEQYSESIDAAELAKQLTTTGQVTAIGRGLEDLALRHSANNLAGLVIVSDFGQNAGLPPAGGNDSPAKRLQRPIYTLGIGPESTVDLGIDLQAPLVMKKNEEESLSVTLRQTALDNRRVFIKVFGKRLRSGDNTSEGDTFVIGQKELELAGPTVSETFSFKPTETGRFQFTAEVDPQEGEVISQNNRSEREVNIRDDFLRLMYVENEPSWEWRFVKEVFHRDKLVGLRGFRTFLNSADPKVRQTNELFLPNLTPRRGDFFANDVIFLGDMPGQRLQSAERFSEMTREFVSKFGGGLVVIAGPRFGPGQLANTPIADMLPVTPDPQQSKPRSDREFTLKLTPNALQFDFMRLGGQSDAENKKAWDNLGRLPWYQPVLRVHPQAVVLAEHPTDLCADGKTKQPLIAVRPYGKGEVIYIAFNETWRLRRKYGELYYRQFWGQMIHRLGLSHAIGTQKRFVVRTDREQYQADELVTLTVEAYNENYEPLTSDKLADQRLQAELIVPSRIEGVTNTQPLGVSQLREGIFEARFPVSQGGDYRVRVVDPITKETSEVRFAVTSLSAERRSAVRNKALEQQLAADTGGKTFDLTNYQSLPSSIKMAVEPSKNERIFPLASTWLCFGLITALLILEWLVRKLVNLA